jgi:hypothetical protein
MLKANQTSTNSYMPEEILPPEYNREANSTHRLSRLELQRAMTDVKRFVESRLESDLGLVKVSNHQPNDRPWSHTIIVQSCSIIIVYTFSHPTLCSTPPPLRLLAEPV